MHIYQPARKKTAPSPTLGDSHLLTLGSMFHLEANNVC